MKITVDGDGASAARNRRETRLSPSMWAALAAAFLVGILAIIQAVIFRQPLEFAAGAGVVLLATWMRRGHGRER